MLHGLSRKPLRLVSLKALIAGAALSMGAAATPAEAGPRGSEFDTTLTPAAGGMEGVAIARPQDPVAMLFANPATLTQLKGDNAFLLGASFIKPSLKAEGDPTDLFGGPPNQAPLTGSFDGESRLTAAATPHAAAVHRLNDRIVLGVGFTGVSGLGGDFRNEGGLPNLVSDLKIFGANGGGSVAITDRWSVGAVATLGIGSLQIGLTESTGSVNNFGVGGTIGTTYDTGPLIIGAAYKSPLKINYKSVIETVPDTFSNLELEQPQEVQFGIATTDFLFPNTILAADFRWKNWSNAETYQDFWDDQFIGSLGIQHTIPTPLGALALRSGYSYSSDLRKDADELGNSFGSVSAVAAPDGSGSLPVTPTFLQLAQATIADGFWRQSVSFGVGLELSDTVRVDMNGNFAFDGEESFDRFESDGSIWSAGMGITWGF